MKLVVGLGNPGSQYARTRHNIGWLVVDRLADRAGWAGRGRQRDASSVVMGRYKGLDLTLVKPLTYMNDSGLAVRKVLAREHAPLVDLLVVADDFALPFGKLRFREGGSHGGHNGLRSIVDELGTEKFSRLRVGIGDPDRGAIDHVLSTFEPDESRSPRRAPRRGRGRGRSLGARGNQQGGQSLQHVRAAPGRYHPARRAGRGRRPRRRRRDPPDTHRLAPDPARLRRTTDRCPHRLRRSEAGAAATDGSPSASRPTSPPGMHLRLARRWTSTSPRSTPRSRTSADEPPRRPGRPGRSAREGDPPGPSAAKVSAHRLPDLSVLPPLLADTGTFGALRERLGRPTDDPRRVGRHVGLVAVPHGAKSYLAAARWPSVRPASVWSGSPGTRRSATGWPRSSARGSAIRPRSRPSSREPRWPTSGAS